MIDREWRQRTFRTSEHGSAELYRRKETGGERISVVLPALNEAPTVGAICETIRRRLMEDVRFVDELIVIDSGSTDATIEVARDAGATVHRGEQLTDFGPILGKGDCLWRSLSVVDGEIVVWLDSDTRNLHESFVLDLVAPLLGDERFLMSKAFYDRPLVTDEQVLTTGGARITEIAVRPLLQLFYPELTGLIQPLSGEYAGYVDLFRSLPFFTGYGVEVGLLLDIAERLGVERIAQVDLGRRVHRNRTVLELGQTSMQVITALLRRLDDLGRVKIPEEVPAELLQFVPSSEGPEPVTTQLDVVERPPMDHVMI